MKLTKFISAICMIILINHSEAGYAQNSYGWERVYNSIYGIEGSYVRRTSDDTKLWLVRPVYNLFGTGYYDFIKYRESSNSWYPVSNTIFKAVYYQYSYGQYTISGYENPPCFEVSPLDTSFVLVNTTVSHFNSQPYDKRLYCSYNNGLSILDILDFQYVRFHGIVINPLNDSICYATFGDTIVKSTNRGASWLGHSGLFSFSGRLEINPVDTNILYAIDDSLWLSTNGGMDFQVTSEKKFSQFQIGSSGLELVATANHRLYASLDKGFTWIARDSLSDIITAIDTDPDNENIIYAGTDRGLYKSTNSGINFQFFNNSFSPTRKIQFICKQPATNFVYVVTDEAVYKCWNSFLVDAEDISIALPREFRLQQNYPNPFNPSTKISYELHAAGYIILKVFDALGKEVVTLVNERKNAGSHEVEFNASNLPSGVYFYSLYVDGKLLGVKRMSLVK
jgi:hypothetical protein